VPASVVWYAFKLSVHPCSEASTRYTTRCGTLAHKTAHINPEPQLLKPKQVYRIKWDFSHLDAALQRGQLSLQHLQQVCACVRVPDLFAATPTKRRIREQQERFLDPDALVFCLATGATRVLQPISCTREKGARRNGFKHVVCPSPPPGARGLKRFWALQSGRFSLGASDQETLDLVISFSFSA
jgi:hypothetical protein